MAAKPNPMAARPDPCPCGAQGARNSSPIRCQICAKIAAEHPDWTPEQVTAAGGERWLELALTGTRTAARRHPGQTLTLAADQGREVQWTVKEGYERLQFTGEPAAVLAALSRIHTDLLVMETAVREEYTAVKLVPRTPARCACRNEIDANAQQFGPGDRCSTCLARSRAGRGGEEVAGR